MNKKIIRGFLMFALAVFSMSSFVACKDYDDAAYDNVKARLNQEITLREALQQQVDALEAYVKTIKSCQCDLEKALKDYLTKDEAAKTYVTIENYNTAIALLQKSISEINEKITIINNTLGNVDLSKGTVAEQLANLNQLILNVQALAEKAMELAEQNKEDISKLKKAVEELQGQYIELDKRLTELEKKAAELEANYTALEARVTINEGDIRNIYNILDNLNIPDMSKYVTKDQLEAAKQEALAAAADSKALAQKAWDKAIEAYNLANQANTTANNALDKANDAMDKANENAGRIDALEAKVAELEAKFAEYLTKAEFEAFKTEYEAKIAEIEGRLDAIEDRLDVLETTVDKLKQDVLKSMITGIIVQGTVSPVVGYLNTPFDLRSNMLAAYYGELTKSVKFPVTTNTEDLVREEMKFTGRNYEVMGGMPSQTTIPAGLLVRDADDNAGTLYLTINPNTVSFEGAILDMETSAGNASPIKLSPLEYTDDELQFGYTRSAANGFYKAKAQLPATQAAIDAAKMKIDYTTLENEAKDVIKNKDKNSVLTFGAALMNSVKDVMPAYAVKASWTDTAGDGVEHNLFSEYSLATTAIKPLSYAFLKDFKANLPGEEKLQDLLTRLFNKINITVDLDMPDFSSFSINFGLIDLSGLKNADGKILVHIQYVLKDDAGNPIYVLTTDKAGKLTWMNIGGQVAMYQDESGTWYNANGTVVTFQQVEINTDVDLTDLLTDIVNQVNTQWEDAQRQLTDMLNEINKLNNVNDQINASINTGKNDVKSQLSQLISRAYNKLNSFFSKAPNAALQPVLVSKSGNNVRLLSRSKASPTKVSGSLTLYPTSFTLELLAPAYKKFVAVTDVWDAAGNPAPAADGQAANGNNMLTVFEGTVPCTLNAGKAGYTYEISYSAVDYHGKVTTKRFYVKF